MNMIRNKNIDLFIELYILLVALRNICLFAGLTGPATVLFFAVYIVVTINVVIVIYHIIRRPIIASLYFLASIVLLLALIVIPLQYGGSIWTFNGYMSISFFLTMILIIVSKRVVVSLHTIAVSYRVSIIQALFALLLSLLPSSYQNGVLDLHMGNPNQTAIVLWTIFSFCFLYWSKKKHSKRSSIGLWIIMIGVMALIYLTESRTAILSFVIAIILYYFVLIRKNHKEIPIIPQMALFFSPILIPTFVLSLTSILPNNITFLGKMIFSGREVIWRSIVNEFLSHPFVSHLDESPYSHSILQNGSVALKSMGAHNALLAVQWYYGLIVALLVLFILLVRCVDIKRCAAKNRNACVAYIIILATFFYLSFEEGMLMGNLCTTMLLPVLFIFGQSEEFFESSIE